jgi:predicted nuclease of predicted toxin-antitoxin system
MQRTRKIEFIELQDKFLFDQNIAYRAIKLIPDEFKDSSHVKSEDLIKAADRKIWEYAKKIIS